MNGPSGCVAVAPPIPRRPANMLEIKGSGRAVEGQLKLAKRQWKAVNSRRNAVAVPAPKLEFKGSGRVVEGQWKLAKRQWKLAKRQ